MKILKKLVPGILLLSALLAVLALPAFAADTQTADSNDDAVVAEEQTEDGVTGAKAIACAIAVGLAAAGGAIGMGMTVAKSADGISRQPEAEGKIRTSMMLGLVFIETAIIYALLVVILIIFVL
jgi:F-type H+-transporting ATPase subunit c